MENKEEVEVLDFKEDFNEPEEIKKEKNETMAKNINSFNKHWFNSWIKPCLITIRTI